MKLFDFKKSSKYELSTDDLVLISMLNFPNGAIGESSIHEFLYYLTMEDEFKQYHQYLGFKEGDTYCYSESVHRSIEANTKDLRNSIEGLSGATSEQTFALFSDRVPIELYSIVEEKEKEFSRYIRNYYPRVVYISRREIAQLVAKEKLTEEQRHLLKLIADKVSFD